MNRLRLTALWVGVTLGAVMLSWGESAPTAPTETVETATVQLEVGAEPGLLISRLNPPRVELDNPFKPGNVLTAVMDGRPYPDNPAVYYARLNPVTWALTVPQGTAPGRYPAEIRVTFALCSKTQGFCFTDEQTASATVQVGGGENEAVVVWLRQPKH